jgi:glycosyltransferase involved in cell wall biosynthesis
VSTIGLDVAGLLTDRPTGVGIFGRALVGALAARATHDYVLVHPWGRWRRRRCLPASGLPLLAYASGSRLERRFPLLHTLDTRWPTAYRGAWVATLYDVISALPLSAELGLSNAEFRAKKLRAYQTIAERAAAIVTISEASARDIREYLKPRGEVVVIPSGVRVTHGAGEEADRRAVAALGVRGRFLLCVGALCPRKNLGAVARAFESARRDNPELQLVLVGEPEYGWAGSSAERAIGRLREEASGAVLGPGYVSDELLWALYRQAALCVHLAHYEGLGLPVIEAQAAGTPVVASRRGGVVDAAGEAAWLVNPDDDGEVAKTLCDVLRGGVSIEQSVELGLSRAAGFTWEQTAAHVEAVYARVLNSV